MPRVDIRAGMCGSLQLTELRSLQLTETCRLNFSQAHVILKDPGSRRVVVFLTRVAAGLMASLQESVLHLVAKHCVCV